jgi:transglutaminase-like putative cysteine protease
MTMQYTIRHETRCHFDHPASYSIRNLRVTPREEGGLRITQWQVSTPTRPTRGVDAWGNTTHQIALTEPHEDVRIIASGIVEVPDQAQVHLEALNDLLPAQIYLPQTSLTAPDDALREFALTHFGSAPPSIPRLSGGLTALQALITPSPSAGESILGAAKGFARRSATVQDQVHMMLSICRQLGIPARFVSGYMLGEKITEYAWADVWLASEGHWISFDVRRAHTAYGRLIRLAVGRDYLDTCPMRTAHQGGGHEEVRVSLQAL